MAALDADGDRALTVLLPVPAEAVHLLRHRRSIKLLLANNQQTKLPICPIEKRSESSLLFFYGLIPAASLLAVLELLAADLDDAQIRILLVPLLRQVIEDQPELTIVARLERRGRHRLRIDVRLMGADQR
jgi:hypothetical protein